MSVEVQTCTLYEFLVQHELGLPIIVRVDRGFLGIDELHTFASGETLYLHKIKRKTRYVLSEEATSRVFSIPSNSSIFFNVLPPTGWLAKGSNSVPMTLSDIVTKHRGPAIANRTLRVQPSFSSSRINLMSPTEKSILNMGVVTINVDEPFDEMYVIAVAVYNSGQLTKPFAIPGYVPIYVTIAIDQRLEPSTLKAASRMCADIEMDDLHVNHEIMIYNEKHADVSLYQHLVPKGHFALYSTLTPAAKDLKLDTESDYLHPFQEYPSSGQPEIKPRPSSTRPKTSTLPPALPPRPKNPTTTGSSNSGTLPSASRTLPAKVYASRTNTENPTYSVVTTEDVNDVRSTESDMRSEDKPQFDVASAETAELIEQMTVDDVANLAKTIGVPENVITNLRQERIDGLLLLELCKQDMLVSELGFSKLHAVKMKMAIQKGWRPSQDRTML